MKKIFLTLCLSALSVMSVFSAPATKQQGPTKVNGAFETTGTATVNALNLGGTAITATGAELNNTAGTTGPIQTQIDGKVGADSPTFTTQTTFNFATALTVPYFDASKNLISSVVTATELGYLSGVTSAIQTQLNGKVSTATTVNGYPLSSNVLLTADDIGDGIIYAVITLTQESNFDTAYTHSQTTTGNPHSVTAAELNLGNVDNTADANKPISTATQSALDGKVGTASNTGTAGVGIFKQKSTYDLEFYKVLGSGGISWALNGTDYIDVMLSTSGLASATPASGMKLYIDDSGTTKVIDWDDLPGAGGGETNTVSNTGTAGIGIFKQKNIYDFELYKVLGSGGISWALNGTDYIDAKLSISGLSSVTPASGMKLYIDDSGTTKVIDWDDLPNGSPGGSDTQVQYNNSSAFGGSANFTWNNGTSTLTITGTVAADTISEQTTDAGVTVDSCLIKDGAAALANDVNIAALTTEATPASGMKLIIDNAGIRKKIDWDDLPGASGGEANTASNTGSSGVGMYKTKSGVDLLFYKLLGSDGVSIALNGTDYIDVKADINSLTEEATPATGDFFMMYDATAGVNKKVAIANMPGSAADAIHDNVSGEINAITEKASPVSADILIIEDSADSYNKKKIQIGNLPSSGGSALSAWGKTWQAVEMPQDWKESVWTNVGSNRPTLDYDQINVPVWRCAYNAAEGLGIFVTPRLPAGVTNLVFTLDVQAQTPGATGDNMGWKADIVRYRAGTAQSSIETVTLGSTALQTTGITQASYSVAVSGLSNSVTTDDTLAFIIYPNTAVSSPKQTDWMVISFTIGVN